MAVNISNSLAWISFATRKIINLMLAALERNTSTRPGQSRREVFRVVATLHRYYVTDPPIKISEDYSSDDGSEYDADAEVEDLRDVDDQNMDFSLELDTDLNTARIFDAELEMTPPHIADDTSRDMDDLDQSQYSCDDSLYAHNATYSDLDVTYTIAADATNSEDTSTNASDSDASSDSDSNKDAIEEKINVTDFLEIEHESCSEDSCPNLSYMEVSGFNSDESDHVLMCR